jgi:hypothetical protein
VSKSFLIALAAAVLLIVPLIGTGFVWTVLKSGDKHLAFAGSIGKIRTLKVADDITLMVVDFKVKNDSDRDLVVRTTRGDFTLPDGSNINGSMIAASDAAAAFRSYPLLGEQYNPVLKENDTIPAHQAVDRMVGVRFDAPYETVEQRKKMSLKIEDLTGQVVELTK